MRTNHQGWIATRFGLVLFSVFAAALIAWLVLEMFKITLPQETTVQQFERYYVTTDPGTGCQYVTNGRGLTPRLDQHGKPVCRK